jgi:DNA repair exonuclease SbcCD ATPase subunit
MITLSLTNFRCWEEKTFTFPTTGICLIHGRSGRGKSTILNAIHFALSGKLKNITTFGKRSTKVQLTFPDNTLSITRTRNPVSLSVAKKGVSYIDDEAQAVIDSMFGRHFANTSYIDQDNSFSFASMSPGDKMEFLESVMMEEFAIDKMRDRIKDDMALTKVRFAEWEGKISSLRGMLASLKRVNVPELTIEKVKVTSQNVGKVLEKVNGNLTTTERNSKICMSRLRKLEETYTNAHEKRELRAKYQAILDKLAELDTQISEVSAFGDDGERVRLEEKKRNILVHQQALQARERKAELDAKIEELTFELGEKRAEYEVELALLSPSDLDPKTLETLKYVVKSIEKLTELDDKLSIFDKANDQEWLAAESERLNEMRAAIKAAELAEQSLECPSCGETVRLVDRQLVKLEKIATGGNVAALKRELDECIISYTTREKRFHAFSSLEDQYNSLFANVENQLEPFGLEVDVDAVTARLEAITAAITKRDALLANIKQIDNDRTVQSFRRDRDQLVEKYGKVWDSDIDMNTDLSTVVQELTVFNEKNARYKTLHSRQSELHSEKRRLSVPDDGDDNSVDLEQLTTEREKYAEYEEKVKKYRMFVDQIGEWQRLLAQREQYEKVENEIGECTDRRDDMSDRMRGLVKLRDHLKNAEKQCMDEFIQSLNTHASTYLAHFFEEDDLSVNLRSVQETKTGKEKISLNFEVIYRGMPGDLSFLSGGERDRVNLAFTLALSEMIHPSVLMLDECISSLDAETTAKVLETLRETYRGKLVLLISHQANLGFFDSVVEI